MGMLLFIALQITTTNPENNRLRSPIPPLTIPLDDMPMFLTITFDDALSPTAHAATEQIMAHKNRNNEQIPLVYYISNEFSDYALIQQRYLQGCEMAVHTVTHTTNVHSDITKWFHEINKSRHLISLHSNIPIEEIVGFRAPFLQKSDISFQVLHGLNPKFLYDSTVTSQLTNDFLFEWPYTLDNYEAERVYSVGEGPLQSYPGLWEVPMFTLYSDISSALPLNIMDYTGGDYESTLAIFKQNFLYRLHSNRAPMGLYFHSAWLSTASNVNALNDFISWVLAMDQTWIVTNKAVIAWLNNPVSSADYAWVNSNALISDKSEFLSCQFTEGVFQTVQSECPTAIPHTLVYDSAQLIHASVLVSSTNDNIVTTQMDICAENGDSEYEADTIYCANAAVLRESVRYNNVLYQCKYWIKGALPDMGADAWQFVENCVSETSSFVKGVISPYGTVTAFIDSALEIEVTFICGYTIDSAVMNPYLSALFDDYELNINSANTAATLIIRFAQIVLTDYEIVFSFTETECVPPTAVSTEASMPPTIALTVQDLLNRLDSAPADYSSGNTLETNEGNGIGNGNTDSTNSLFFSNNFALLLTLLSGVFMLLNLFLYIR